jgi:hypothetical protein
MSEIQIAGAILFMLGVAAWWLTDKENKEKKQNEENKRGCCLNCYHEQHKDCYCLDCQCKNEVCSEIRKKYWQKRRALIGTLVVGQDVLFGKRPLQKQGQGGQGYAIGRTSAN